MCTVLKSSERGAVAVEMALLLPILLLMVLGTIEFGRALNAQITLTHAAREGVRVMAITGDPAAGQATAREAAVSLDIAKMVFPPSPTDCPDDAKVTMTITYELSTITGIAGPFNMVGKGVMACGG